MLQPHEEDRNSESAPGALVEACATHDKKLRQILIHVRRGRSGYVATGKYLNRITAGELKSLEEPGDEPKNYEDETPEEIALTVWKMAFQHAANFGPSWYGFIIRDGDEKELDRVALQISADGDDAGKGSAKGKEERESEAVDMVRLAKLIAADSHANYMALSKEHRTLVKDVGAYAKVASEADINATNKEYDLRSREVDARENMAEAAASAQKWAAAMTPITAITEQIGAQIGERLKFWMKWAEQQMAAHGVDPPPTDFGSALSEILAAADDLDPVKKVADELDPELWVLLENLKGTRDNGEFQNIAAMFKRRAVETLQAGKNPQLMMDALQSALPGDEFKRLVLLLRASGAL